MKKGLLIILSVLLGFVSIHIRCNKKVTEPEGNLVAPTLSSPTDGAIISNNRPKLQWNAVANASVYEVVVDNINDFSSPEFSSADVMTDECTTDSLHSDLYYWKVRAKNGDWSEVWCFIIDIEGPSAPILIMPPNGITTNDNTPSFTWSAVSDAVSYALEVDSSDSFSNPLIYQNNLTGIDYTVMSTLTDGTYFWHVRCTDILGNWGDWSETWLFTISMIETGTVTDIDGNVYKTVKIGNQWWMAENLKVTRYSNGDSLYNVTDDSEWSSLATGAYCNYNNDVNYADTYGHLYNWYTVNDSRKLAPRGWRIPSDADWKVLEMYLGMSQSDADNTGPRGIDEGGRLKETGTTHWESPNTGATNETGFSALPGGYRGSLGRYQWMGRWANFWTSSGWTPQSPFLRSLDYDSSTIFRTYFSRNVGYSVRCIRDY